jgi:hypothetical protein
VARSQLDVIFGISFVVFAGAPLMLRAAVREVRGGIQRTRRMLPMLPPEVVQRAPPIDAYLKSGRLTMLLDGQGPNSSGRPADAPRAVLLKGGGGGRGRSWLWNVAAEDGAQRGDRDGKMD